MQLLSPSQLDFISQEAAGYATGIPGGGDDPDSPLDFYMKDLFRNLYHTGLRYYELADPTRWEKNVAGEYICTTLKGSNPRTFDAIELSDYFIRCLDDGVDPYPMCRYTTAVRYFKKSIAPYDLRVNDAGISLHTFRHNKCKQMYEDGFSIQEIATYMGEVDSRNITEYVTSSISKIG